MNNPKLTTIPGHVDHEKAQEQAQMLANRVHKTFKRLKPSFDKQNISSFRLYDWDIPEIRAVVDWYNGHVVIAEYERLQTAAYPQWLNVMGDAISAKLQLSDTNTHLKKRRTRPQGQSSTVRYKHEGQIGQHTVQERELQFLVNLDDYVDTGLFSDHRETRNMIKNSVQRTKAVKPLCLYWKLLHSSALGKGCICYKRRSITKILRVDRCQH